MLNFLPTSLQWFPDENYLDAASRLVVRGWGRNVVDVSTGSVRPGTNKGILFFGERNPVPEDRAAVPHRATAGHGAEHVSPHYNRHWYYHILVAFSPGSILPLPFQVWLRFPDGRLITCYHMGMVRDMLLSSCSPDWGHAERFATDFGLKLNEDTAC
ncbi:UNVERIFIED_CONTAM: hypothetical protein Scaly_3106500 [Sesamum calycinum]|uniref:Uncharacterized protein n=1 Tax=Sesamum calycinum TaxID=2727403 RepID=A0AAW2JL79_9LAMI